MRDPFASDDDDDDDGGSTSTREMAEDDDEAIAARTVRPSHDRGDSTGSRFVEGA